jgi:CheY-like chemotaxis protein
MSTYKVLIAEDNRLLASVIAKILSDLNIENTTVYSGDDALMAYDNNYYDMVLLDIMMPTFSGLQVSQRIRKTNSHIAIVALTSIPFDEIEKDLAISGINHYIKKPAKAKELQNVLKEYFKTTAYSLNLY